MAVETYAYGDVEGVAVYARRFTNEADTFDESTNPTHDQIETWINQVSAMINTMLSTENITTPVTDSELVQMLQMFVESEVGAMVNGTNGAGRLGPTSKVVQVGGFYAAVQNDVADFLNRNAVGFARMGATRTSITSEILYRGTDADGNDTFPMFSRDSFGGETFDEGN